jgi:peroxiredoxin
MTRRILAVCLLALAAAMAHAAELKPWGGGALPQFELKDIEGRAHRLADYHGRVVLVNFWATWCEPCRDEMPSIERLKQRFSGQPFAVLAVNVGEPEARIRRFLAQIKLDFPVLLDPDLSVTKSWQARILPASFLVGRDGRIRYSLVGELDWADEHAVKTVSDLIGAK